MSNKKEYEMKCYAGDEPRINVTKKFVKDNNLKINIDVARVLSKNDGIFDFSRKVATDFLSWDECKKFYKDDFVEDVEKGVKEKPKQVTDVMEAAQDFLDYMVFAWMKAIDERGLSASRSISKLSAWMIILSRPDVADVLEDENNYNPYGRPALKNACKMLNIKYPDYL